VRPATLLPYPKHPGLRSVALRPILSDGLPFSSDFKYLFTSYWMVKYQFDDVCCKKNAERNESNYVCLRIEKCKLKSNSVN